MSADAPTPRPGHAYPPDFYRQVADTYLKAIETTRAPAITIAAQAGVPVRTARGWIARARRRGYLPPGRPGATTPTTPWERVAADLGIDPDQLHAAARRHTKGGLRP